MRKIIHHLRKQDEETKRHILHIATITFGIFLIILWIYSLDNNLTNNDTKTKVKESFEPLVQFSDTIESR